MTQLDRYRLAGDLDTKGDEEGAIVQYDAVFEAGVDGLPSEMIEGFYVGYGSTLRNVGRGDDSLRVHHEGLKRYPHSSALRAFEALTLVASGRANDAVATLILSSLDPATDRSIERFTRSLRAYATALCASAVGEKGREKTP